MVAIRRLGTGLTFQMEAGGSRGAASGRQSRPQVDVPVLIREENAGVDAGAAGRRPAPRESLVGCPTTGGFCAGPAAALEAVKKSGKRRSVVS